jgi:hypothetical protein
VAGHADAAHDGFGIGDAGEHGGDEVGEFDPRVGGVEDLGSV